MALYIKWPRLEEVSRGMPRDSCRTVALRKKYVGRPESYCAIHSKKLDIFQADSG